MEILELMTKKGRQKFFPGKPKCFGGNLPEEIEIFWKFPGKK